MVFTCGTCWREFDAGWRARDQHLNATGHQMPKFECDTCDKYFPSSQARWQHMDVMNHFKYECSRCHETYPDEEGRAQHEVDHHCYCRPCNRSFSNRSNIQQHLNSTIHRNTSVKCPFCGLQCGTATGLVHHVERGSCPSAPLDRDKLYRLIRERDPDGVLSKKLLDWHGSSTFEATDRTWNVHLQAYECYLCHRLFGKLQSLTQHLNSPVHQQALYHCPNRTRCGKDFSTLAGVINHLESESCGFMRFQDVQSTVQRIVEPGRRIEF